VSETEGEEEGMKTWECECGSTWERHETREPTFAGCKRCGKPMREVITVPVHSRLWAIAMALKGERVTHGENVPWSALLIVSEFGDKAGDDGWTLLPPLPPPWAPKAGERVRWYRGEDSGTGTYNAPAQEPGEPTDTRHYVWVGTRSHRSSMLLADRVEPLA
jgi:hypothetical protein